MKRIFVYGIILLFLAIGLSGCLENETNENIITLEIISVETWTGNVTLIDPEGNKGTIQIDGSSSETYTYSGVNISVEIQKLSDSDSELRVNIFYNGEKMKTSATNHAFGIVDVSFSVDEL